MKNNFISVLPGVLLVFALSSCFHDHNISISISDDEDEYEMDASYQTRQTHAVQDYLDNHLLHYENVMHRNHSGGNEITLDDETTFYLKSRPGKLRIKIDKTENSEESYERVKQACEDIKILLASNESISFQ